MLPHRTLILGGARSGKSAFAERLVTATGQARVYVPTALAPDAEMRVRIAAHRRRRGGGWRLAEAAADIAPTLAGCRADEVVLLDCATLWLSHRILAESDPGPAVDGLLAAIGACPAGLIVVSDEVGHGIVPENALARRFRDAQGRMNQRLAAACDLAVLVVAGLPLVLKGRLP